MFILSEAANELASNDHVLSTTQSVEHKQFTFESTLYCEQRSQKSKMLIAENN